MISGEFYEIESNGFKPNHDLNSSGNYEKACKLISFIDYNLTHQCVRFETVPIDVSHFKIIK